MNLVFLSSFEKEGGYGGALGAQVTIGEKNGVWQIAWNEQTADGGTAQELWYEGTAWDAMLQTFRQRLQDKWLQGFSPLVEGVIEGRMELTGKHRFNAMLQCYSDRHDGEETFQKLREWRREQASKEGKAAYLIATNRVLRLIAAFLPHTPEELAQIPWLGAQKAKVYGSGLLAVTVQFGRETSFPLDWVPEAVGEAAFGVWLREQQQMKLRNDLSRQDLKQRLLEGLARGERMETLAQELAITRRDVVQWVETLDEEGYDVDMLLDAELGSVAEEEQKKAWQAFETEGPRYLKPVLHRMYSEQELKELDLDRAYEWLRLLRLKFRKAKQAA